MVFGLAISISSTVVLIRTLSEVGLLDSAHGRIAVGWVVVEDLAIVVVLVLLPPLAPLLGGSGVAGTENLFGALVVTLAKVALFGLLMVVVGTRLIPWLLAEVARTGHRELFTLCVLVVAIVGAGLAQIGEFSFVLSNVDRSLGVLPSQAHDLIIAAALISITLNPLLFRAVDPLAERVRRLSLLRRYEERRAGALARIERGVEDPLRHHAVVCGHGQVGSLVTRALQRRNMECLVIEQDRRIVEDLRASGTLALFGDAGHQLVLERAHLERAILLVIALPDPQTSRRVIEGARRANTRIGIVRRAHTKKAASKLRKARANEVVLGEEELAIEMTGYALHRLGGTPQENAVVALRLRLTEVE